MTEILRACSRRAAPEHPYRSAGFSLIELIVTVAVLAVLVAIALPSFTATINANRLTSQANDLVASLQLAKSEAIRMNARVRLCRSTDGVACAGAGAWTRWIVVGNSQTLGDSTIKPPVQVAGTATFEFRPDGTVVTAGTVTACLPTTKPAENRRVVNVSASGRVSVTPVNGGGVCI